MTAAPAPGMVDTNVPRFNQALVAVLTGIAFVLQWWPLVTFTGIVLLLTRIGGPRWGLFSRIYVSVVRPRLDGAVEWEDARPPRFAQTIGIAFLLGASAAFVLGAPILGWALSLTVTVLAALAATTRICVGCIVYERVFA